MHEGIHVTAAAAEHGGSPARTNLMVDITRTDARIGGCPCMWDRQTYVHLFATGCSPGQDACAYRASTPCTPECQMTTCIHWWST